ncbi:hypothetical protein D7D52_35880 [Nocardia yunnanensis]|uniref:Uncharacterized protein n=1 Tax=Nocardia yunnanensis TaxID=2382165 RepID=A0A386ZM19_9NOCA|nr:hypothetical protein [Nocardia yunnanensis]AYF78320.1 hypothetical protein D7D52_35880 [Nocardia yunnanensis]
MTDTALPGDDHRVIVVRRSVGERRVRYDVQIRPDDPNPEAVAEALRSLVDLAVVRTTRTKLGREVFMLAAPLHRNLAVLHQVCDQLPEGPPPAAAAPDPEPAPVDEDGADQRPRLPMLPKLPLPPGGRKKGEPPEAPPRRSSPWT